MAREFTVGIGTMEDAVVAVGIVTRQRIAHAANIGDASCPVYVQAGEYRRQVGQMADYRHEIAKAAQANGASVIIKGYYAGGSWERRITSTEGEIDDAKITQIIRDRIDASRRKIEAENRSERARETAVLETARKSEIEMMRVAALAAAETWAPGRVAVWQAPAGWVAGRWDDPSIPGYGAPAETRIVRIVDHRRFQGEAPNFTAELTA